MTKLTLALVSLIIAGCATHPSPDERAKRASLLFDQLDVNHDGVLTRAELAAGLTYAGTPEMNPNLVMGLKNDSSKKVKANRKLSEIEIRKAMAEAFGPRKSDVDARLTKDEFKKVVVQRSANDDPWEPFMD